MTTHEVLYVHPDELSLFKRALHNTEIATHIPNVTITIPEPYEGEVRISDTKASFLIQLGTELCKLRSIEKNIVYSIDKQTKK